MPFRRRSRYGRRRGRFGRRRGRFGVPWWKRKYSVGDLAHTAWRGVRYLKGLVNSETFKFDTSTTVNPSSTGAVVHLTAIAQGDGDSDRNGNSVFSRSLYIRGIMTKNASATTTFLRVLIVRDNQQVGDGTPGVTDILESAANTAPLNSNTVGRFTVLWDRIFALDSDKLTDQFVRFIPMRYHIRYNGSAGTDIQKGGLYLVHLSDQATNTPSLNFHARVGYHDN